MGSLKSAVLIASLLMANSVLAKDTQIIGFDGHTLTLRAWSTPIVTSATVSFTANGKTFPLYVSDIGVDTDTDLLSPDKKTLLVNRDVYGVLSGPDGEDIPTQRTYCDVISMETGCVLLQRDARFCSGKWVGNRWTSDDGEVLKPDMEALSPQALLRQVSGIQPAQSRAESIEWNLLFMSADAYMACHPPARNVQALNDLGFFLAEGGNDALALEFYRGVEPVGKRTVLMLNMADSLWRLNRKDEAQRYYSEYGEAMKMAGKAQRIPPRVAERSLNQGLKN
jgi:hypothetical protein